MNKKALILGASGGIGGEVARQLRDAGWEIRVLKRQLGSPSLYRDGMEWVEGDALQVEDVAKAARGCQVIVHAVNPPGYLRWAETVLPMIDNTIAAALAEGATVVLPGTVYNYGPDAFPLLINEEALQNPKTRKGAIRVELEKRLERAAESGSLRVIILRAGDFFGPQAGNNWLAQGMITPGQAIKKIQLPAKSKMAKPGVGHQFAYLPDVARSMVQLLERQASLPAFARFHLAGHWDADGTQLAQAIQRVVLKHGGSAPKLSPFPWWLIRLVSPFVATLRELLEMRYLWQVPVRMDNARLVAYLGAEPHTPLDQAIEATLIGLGCLNRMPEVRAEAEPGLAEPRTTAPTGRPRD